MRLLPELELTDPVLADGIRGLHDTIHLDISPYGQAHRCGLMRGGSVKCAFAP